MLRTFSFEARAVVPTTQGFTSEIPRAGRMRMTPTKRPRGAAEAEAVCDRSTKNGKEPNHAAEDAGERAGLFGGEVEFFLKVDGERGEGAVVGEALENFGDVGDPEGALEAIADFSEALGEGHGGQAG